MNTEQKRRASSRSRRVTSRAESEATSKDQSWSNEVFGGVLVLIALYLGASILSYQSYRGTIIIDDLAAEEIKRNMMGPFGHMVATMMLGVLGWSALVFVGWLLWAGVYIWRHDYWKSSLEVRSKPVFIVGLIGLFVFSSAFLAIVGGRHWGGSAGSTLGDPLRANFGLTGSSVITLTLFLLSVAVSSRRSLADVLTGSVRAVLFSIGFCFGTLPLMAFHSLRSLGRTARLAWEFVYLAVTGSEFDSQREDEYEDKAETPLPKPRARRKAGAQQGAEGWEIGSQQSAIHQKGLVVEKISEKEEPADDYSHVVVSRRRPESAGSEKAKKLKETTEAQRSLGEIFAGYERPDLGLLTRGATDFAGEDDEELLQKSKIIESKLKDFGILGKITQVHPGPVVTLFEFEPAPGIKVGKITALQDDLAMSLRAAAIRVIAPIPKKGTVGIEVPNKQRDIVRLRDLLESEAATTSDSILSVAMGKDTYGDAVVVDIATMPHLLMAGATGTGKSVCINTLLLSLLYRSSPADLGLILIDPKILELSVYEGVPHLRVPVVTAPSQAKAVLQWAVKEMERRYRMMQRFGVRNIDGYNKVVSGEDGDVFEKKPDIATDPAVAGSDDVIDPQLAGGGPEEGLDADAQQQEKPAVVEQLKPLPKIVIVIDELADLMLQVGREIEELITRLAQKARAAGIHLIVATQRPSVDVITGLIKANFPARLSFRVTSRIDSRTILDSMGAEKLLGRGDMLLMLPGAVHVRRVHGAFVSDQEVKKVVDSIKARCKPQYDEAILSLCERALQEETEGGSAGTSDGEVEYDEFYDKAVELVLEKGQASTSMVQRVFRIGYNRAARIIEVMEKEGIIGPMDGVKPREVLLQNLEQRASGEEIESS